MKDQPRASGALPKDDPLYAPGIKWRRRADMDVPYWLPRDKDIQNGFAPKSLTLDRHASQEEIATRCRELWRDLEAWRTAKDQPQSVKYTFGWLVGRYLDDPFSPFQALRPRSQRTYRQFCEIIRATIGERRADAIHEGGVWRPRVSGEDVRRWYRRWGLPDAEGQATTISRARHVIVQLRILASYAVELGVPGAKDLRELLGVLRFPMVPARTVAPTREQVEAIVKAAMSPATPEANPLLSMAITTLAQFELVERRTHIIGTWEDDQWRPGWIWSGISKDWIIHYQQTKVGVVQREFDLKDTPALLALVQQIPEETRVGPVIVCELTGKPWFDRHYAAVFRKIAREAGVPDDVRSMDMRAGGATEADNLPGVSDRDLKAAGGWKSDMHNRYTRAPQRRAQNVVKLRQQANKPETK